MNKKDMLFEELSTLAEQSREDFLKKQYAGYETYMNVFNRLLQEVKSLDIDTKRIDEVQLSNSDYLNEKDQLLATINEITLKTKQLITRIQNP